MHRDLVKAERWPKEMGASYSNLFKLRLSSDYDVVEAVEREAAERAIAAAAGILETVRRLCPQLSGDDFATADLP